jgi:hypothetical protein
MRCIAVELRQAIEVELLEGVARKVARRRRTPT